MQLASFERGLDILARIAEAGEASVESVAADLGIPPSSAYRYVRILRERGLVAEDAGLYGAGPALLELAGRHQRQARLAEVGGALARELADEIGETAVLVIRVGTRALCLRRAEPDKALKYTFAVNQLLPLHAGAGQRVLLAWAPDAVVEQVLAGPLERYTAQTPTGPQLRATLGQVRQAGWVLSRGELEQGAVSMAVPVVCEGEVIASLDVAGPEFRCGTRRWADSTRARLLAAARQLGAALEAHGDRAPSATTQPFPAEETP
ncbi:IclR family transcriptional regulator [Sinomonas halotolerans]|uniref:IclR family transcriptional regulator n=1 Tax=Sinomonas halotolerans TaxID=1644133 RepID=A0ABU9WZA8_9MICC